MTAPLPRAARRARQGPTVHRRPAVPTVERRAWARRAWYSPAELIRRRGGPVAGCLPESCHHTAPHGTWTPAQVAAWHGGQP